MYYQNFRFLITESSREPSRPAPPYRIVGEPQPFEICGIVKVPTVKNDRFLQHGSDALEIWTPKFLPLRHDNQRIRIQKRRIRIVPSMRDTVRPRISARQSWSLERRISRPPQTRLGLRNAA